MPSYAAVMTTNIWDGFAARQFARAEANARSGDLYVLANETDGPVPIPATYRSLSINEATVRALGLQVLYDLTLFCHNVDYFYLYFYSKHPAYDFYIFFDYPVYIDADVDALIAQAAADGIGLIAQPLDVPMEAWVYTKPHASVYPPAALRGTLLPMVVLSNAALASLMQRRIALSQRYAQQPDFFWPFCEAFVPTELQLAGFKAAPLSDYGSVELFSWWRPTLDSAIPAGLSPAFVHPLLDRPRYIKTLLRHTKARDLLRATIRAKLTHHLSVGEFVGPFLAETLRRFWGAVHRFVPKRHKPTALLWKAAPPGEILR